MHGCKCLYHGKNLVEITKEACRAVDGTFKDGDVSMEISIYSLELSTEGSGRVLKVALALIALVLIYNILKFLVRGREHIRAPLGFFASL